MNLIDAFVTVIHSFLQEMNDGKFSTNQMIKKKKFNDRVYYELTRSRSTFSLEIHLVGEIELSMSRNAVMLSQEKEKVTEIMTAYVSGRSFS